MELAPKAQRLLLEYCLHVADHSPRLGLVSARDIPNLVQKHVASSLGVLALEQPAVGDHWVDVGSGSGLPGLIVKVCRPEASVTLIDSSQKKTVFLQEEALRLGIDDLDVICSRVEEPFESQRLGSSPTFDVVLMRAVAPLPDCLRWASRISRNGSRLFVFKGPGWAEDLDRASGSLLKFGWTFSRCLQIPWAPPKLLAFLRVRPEERAS
ncbi:MAG: 16S rRNA (guanine(527)-N(7))-methyltransferase RsmG [Candidatus Eisenbacteria bacterium]|uniref:Ribosomal RNA small subunit methyltransferase G n=1 Tax=Eiseniibacteriota bacterium TaxID=2212470 RepID=A0A938BPT8_UNCEI|nr:16S rRNA (guanine(527)-N(7))-methyltransferase RsmG [Candidatus Eisenbacteria bacterium]